MDQVVNENRNQTENMELISGPSTEESKKSSTQDEVMPLIVTNKNVRNKKVASVRGNADVKKKAATIRLTRQNVNRMVIDCIKALRKRNGVSFKDICEYIEENYDVNMELLKTYISDFLKSNIESGVLENVNKTAGEEKFKLKKKADIAKTTENSLLKDDMEAKAKKRKANSPVSESRKKKIIDTAANDAEIESKSGAGGEAVESSEVAANSNTTKISVTNENVAEKVKFVRAAEKSENKNASHPPTSEMVLDSIKALKKRNGATFDDISKYMEEKYHVNMKVLKAHVNRFLKKSVDNDLLEIYSGSNAEEKYKIKKLKNVEKESRNVRQKKGKGKSETKRGAAKNPTRK